MLLLLLLPEVVLCVSKQNVDERENEEPCLKGIRIKVARN